MDKMFIMALGQILGLVTGFTLVAMSKPITLKIYSWFGISEPSNIVLQALFNCSLYLFAILGAITIAFLFGLFIKNMMNQETKSLGG